MHFRRSASATTASTLVSDPSLVTTRGVQLLSFFFFFFIDAQWRFFTTSIVPLTTAIAHCRDQKLCHHCQATTLSPCQPRTRESHDLDRSKDPDLSLCFLIFFPFHFVDCNGSLIMEVRSGLLVLVFSRMKMKVVVYGGFEDAGLLLYWWFGMDEKRKIKVRLDSLIMNKGAWFGGRKMGDKSSFSVSSSLVFFPLM
ncbi:hypothetical protein DEO72_LG8g1102 [Vigna unguiculata]|uniref:Uncharacterized protein n=1 Tax=Vigna unguiculata TaxID=3917 RepID=A0A4D6MNY5_VIGUN|nr:hypothetical protein DEO72_LG8g1102 [Vigna unguiculata]